MTWGPQVKKLEAVEESTGITPPALESRPKLFGLCVEVDQAFKVLSDRRSLGFGENPVQLSEIESFTRLFGAPSMSMDVFVHLIGAMDRKYLEIRSGNKSSS